MTLEFPESGAVVVAEPTTAEGKLIYIALRLTACDT